MQLSHTCRSASSQILPQIGREEHLERLVDSIRVGKYMEKHIICAGEEGGKPRPTNTGRY